MKPNEEMMAVIEFTKDDVGKSVIAGGKERIGRIVETRGGTAYVDPDPDVADTIRSELGWSDVDEETYPLNGDDVTEVTDDEVRLGSL